MEMSTLPSLYLFARAACFRFRAPREQTLLFSSLQGEEWQELEQVVTLERVHADQGQGPKPVGGSDYTVEGGMFNSNFSAAVKADFDSLEETTDAEPEAVTKTSDAFAGLFLDVAADVAANKSNSSEGVVGRRLSAEDGVDDIPGPTGEALEAELRALQAQLNAVSRQARVLEEDRAILRARAAVLPTVDDVDERLPHGRALAERRLAARSEANAQTSQLLSNMDRLISSDQKAIDLLQKQPRRPSYLRTGVIRYSPPLSDLEEIHGGEDLDEESGFAGEDESIPLARL